MARKSKEREPLEQPEMVEILEDIARQGGDTARIAAIKALLALKGHSEAPSGDDWEAIYGSDSNVSPIRRSDGA
jgi:hypothetical protein